MAARKKTTGKKKTGQVAAAGMVRFKTGFPAGIRNAIRRRYGDNWHLSLQILDGDDGDGDDGDGDDGSASRSTRSARKSPTASKKRTPAARKKSGRSR
jgi:hypothetical protein